jgi:hypothetical protein
VTHTQGPAFELTVGVHAADGSVLMRARLCWPTMPPAAAVLDTLATRALDAHRRGGVLCIESAPASVAFLLLVTGLSAPEGPIVVH